MSASFIYCVGLLHSSATLPVTLHCMEQKRNICKQVAHFMLPIGATMNMDGAALYEAIAALFIAQVNNMEFNLGQLILLRYVQKTFKTLILSNSFVRSRNFCLKRLASPFCLEAQCWSVCSG